MGEHQVVIKGDPSGRGAELVCLCGWVTTAATIPDAYRVAEMHEAARRRSRRPLETIPGAALVAAIVGSVVVAVVLVTMFGPM